jgi:hypothetical protein
MKSKSVLTLTFLLLFISCLFACTKDKSNWSCDCVYTFKTLDEKCQWTMTRIGFPHDNLTNDEIHVWEDSQSGEHYFLFYGQQWKVSGDCHCLPYYCPEY